MKGIVSGIYMGFIGVILSIKRKGFRFIGLWYILYRVQNVSGSRRPDVGRGDYTHLAYLLLPFVIFYCSSSTPR